MRLKAQKLDKNQSRYFKLGSSSNFEGRFYYANLNVVFRFLGMNFAYLMVKTMLMHGGCAEGKVSSEGESDGRAELRR
jgi:hypothetical protein